MPDAMHHAAGSGPHREHPCCSTPWQAEELQWGEHMHGISGAYGGEGGSAGGAGGAGGQ